jgi:hypothetical protein
MFLLSQSVQFHKPSASNNSTIYNSLDFTSFKFFEAPFCHFFMKVANFVLYRPIPDQVGFVDLDPAHRMCGHLITANALPTVQQ